MDDRELVSQILQGNLAAYADLINRYTGQIAALCRAHVRRPEVVEDLVQETFLRGLDKLAGLREPDCFGAWLYGIALNLCRDWLNNPNNKHLSLEITEFLLEAPAPADHSEWAERSAHLKKCVSHLPAELREVVEIYYAGGRVTYQEMADRLGVSFGQVNKLLTRARKILRAWIAEPDPIPSGSSRAAT